MKRSLKKWLLGVATASIVLQTVVSCDGGRFGPSLFLDRGFYVDEYVDVFPAVYDTGFYYDDYYYDDYYYDDYYYDDFYYDGYYY